MITDPLFPKILAALADLPRWEVGIPPAERLVVAATPVTVATEPQEVESVRAELKQVQAALDAALRENARLRAALSRCRKSAHRRPPRPTIDPKKLVDGGEGDLYWVG